MEHLKVIGKILAIGLVLFVILWLGLSLVASIFAFAHFTFKWAIYIAGIIFIYYLISAIIAFPQIKADVDKQMKDSQS